MPALSIAAEPPFAANDIEDAVSAIELDWLESALRDDLAPGVHTDPDFDLARIRLERLAIAHGMPESSADDAASWAAQYLRQHGRPVPQPAALTVGTPEYRQRHIAMLWQANMWHEAVMLLSGAGAIGFLFYAIAQGLQSWM